VQITFDPAKDASNRAKHGVSLVMAARFEWETALTWTDARQEYREVRECAIGYIGRRLHFVAFTDRDGLRRIISLRRANLREAKRYAKT
jgi:uncharacterized DUF497 family protein